MYNENGSLVASCLRSQDLGLKSCFYRHQSDLISYAGKNVKLLTICTHKVGALVDDKIYPIIENFQGSVVGILNEDGNEFLVKRLILSIFFTLFLIWAYHPSRGPQDYFGTHFTIEQWYISIPITFLILYFFLYTLIIEKKK